ncbi:MAG: hypothetical protein WBF48_04985 [Halarcobacter sp.]
MKTETNLIHDFVDANVIKYSHMTNEIIKKIGSGSFDLNTLLETVDCLFPKLDSEEKQILTVRALKVIRGFQYFKRF